MDNSDGCREESMTKETPGYVGVHVGHYNAAYKVMSSYHILHDHMPQVCPWCCLVRHDEAIVMVVT